MCELKECPYCKGVGEHAVNCFAPVPKTWKDIPSEMVAVFATDHAKLVSDVNRLSNALEIEIRLRAAEQDEIARLKRANAHDCINVQTLLDQKAEAEADNTRLRQRIDELEKERKELAQLASDRAEHITDLYNKKIGPLRQRIAELEAAHNCSGGTGGTALHGGGYTTCAPEEIAKKILTDRGGYEDRHRRATKTIRAAIDSACAGNRAAGSSKL